MSRPGVTVPISPRVVKISAFGLAVLLLGGLWVALNDRDGLEQARDRALQLRPRPSTQPVMVGWHEKFNDVDGMLANEQKLGTRFAVVRYYNRWGLPERPMEKLVAETRLVVSSHGAPAGGWTRVASGAEDRTVVALADRYRSYGTQVVFVFHHEPHDEATDVKGGNLGTAAEYRSAWRRIRRIFVARGAHISAGGGVLLGYSAIDFWALKGTPGGSPGSGDTMYPGDDVVDVLAHDAYNWAHCHRQPWKSFAQIWMPLLAMAARHDKPLIAAEFGSAPGERDRWFTDAARFMRTDPLARERLVGMAYFHAHMDDCHWDFMNQDDGRRGWVRSFRGTPGFTGRPFSLVRP